MNDETASEYIYFSQSISYWKQVLSIILLSTL